MERWAMPGRATHSASSAGTRTNRSSWKRTASSTSTPPAGRSPKPPTSPLTRKECNSVNTTSDLTIVIPAKNEAKLLPRLLTSLSEQDYPQMRNTKVYVADAGSTDGTPEIARRFAGRLDIEVIPGGLPATGRNNGARLAVTPYVLFIDADIELADRTLVRRAL